MVSVKGSTWAGLVGGSLLRGVGLEGELVCDNLKSYEDRIVELAINREEMNSVVRKLDIVRERGGGIYDTRGWVEKFERGVKIAYERGDDGEDIIVE